MNLPKDLRWIEVDYPHLIAFKEEKLANDLPKCRLERIKLDLSDLPARKEFFNRMGTKVNPYLM